MSENEQIEAEPDTPPGKDIDSNVKEFLAQEYSSLVSMYLHTEDTIGSLFNFYLTLLTTVTGGAIILGQLNSDNITLALPPIAFLLVLALVLGIITQEAILSKNATLVHLGNAINLLKDYALKDSESARKRVYYLHNPFHLVSPVSDSKKMLFKLNKYFWWTSSLGSHQLFINVFNSMLLGFLVFVLVENLAQGAVSQVRIFVVASFVLAISYITHNIYARREFNRRVKEHELTIANTDLGSLKF